MADELVIVLHGATTRAWSWVISRTLLVAALGVAFTLSESDPRPSLYIGAGCMAYVTAWFVYLYCIAARVRYMFGPKWVEAWRGERLMQRVSTKEIETVTPSWWSEGLSNLFPNVWLWLPKLYVTLKDGTEVAFPSIALALSDDSEVFSEIHSATGKSFRTFADS